MTRKLFSLLIFACVLSQAVFAQKKKRQRENRIVTVTGRPLTSIDSLVVKQLYFSALREKTIENYPKAGEYFARVLDIDPQNDAAMYELSNVYHLGRNDGKAKELLERAVTVNPENEWYWQALAKMYNFNTEWEKEQQVYSELIRINPEKTEYYLGRGHTLFQLGKYDEALSVYAELEKRTGLIDELVAARQRAYLKTNKTEKAIGDLQKLISENPDEQRYYLMLAEVYNSNGQNDKALDVLKKAKEKDPSSAMVALALADVNRDLKNDDASFLALKSAFSSADLSIDEKLRILNAYAPKMQDPAMRPKLIGLAQELVRVHPGDARAWSAYGDLLIRNLQTKEAVSAYRKALDIDEQLYPVWEQLVRIELSQNDFPAVIKDGEEALSFFPNQAWMNLFVGVAHAQKKDHQKALTYLKTAAALQSDDKELLAQVWSSLGDSYHALGDHRRSDESYDKALSYVADNAYTLNNYAYYLALRKENLPKAEKMAKRANELLPNTGSFEDTYAWVLFRMHKYNDARAWMEKALSRSKKQSAGQLEHYGDILFHLGRTDEAVSNWQKAKEAGLQSSTLDRKINEKKYVE
ncbi:MAG: tetratricopeptide repeat protein [Mucilaginibacter polytrichastri]|nr:tetratricopeptide repeat protein [Mucilaginibacter polytrichastri]